ncbi:MAG: hypothetical protein ACOCUH_01425 [Bacteriovoracia bacterium]
MKLVRKKTLEIDTMTSGKKNYRKIVNDFKNKFWLPTTETLRQKSRKDIIDNYATLNNVLAKNILKEDQQQKLMKLRDNMKNHLLEMKCLPVSWHEYRLESGETPEKINCD